MRNQKTFFVVRNVLFQLKDKRVNVTLLFKINLSATMLIETLKVPDLIFVRIFHLLCLLTIKENSCNNGIE